jgi:adenylosuccinate synthase
MKQMKQINVIVDLQFGSTGKGLLAGYLAETTKPDTVITAWAANAGHTYINADGRKFVHTMLANGVVSPNLKQVMIGAGSLIDPVSLLNEINACIDLLGDDVKIYIHKNAAVIEQRHRDEENEHLGANTRIGSTKKGCGAAQIQRIRRDPRDLNTFGYHYDAETSIAVLKLCNSHPNLIKIVDTDAWLQALNQAEVVQIEGAQGYSLSMYHGMYPYTTSRDVTTAQVLADCGIPHTLIKLVKVYGTARTFPIRVANRYDENGKQVGYSGDCYSDQEEITFEDLGQSTEFTTVTKLPRRIFTFSAAQIQEAAFMCGVDVLFMNFINYCRTEEEMREILTKSYESIGAPELILGFGATVNDVVSINTDRDFRVIEAEVTQMWGDSRAGRPLSCVNGGASQ